jgi:YD repeat-containing protein
MLVLVIGCGGLDSDPAERPSPTSGPVGGQEEPIDACELLAPLAEHPTRDRPFVPEELVLDGVRLGAKQIDRYELDAGIARLQLNTTTLIPREAANFNLRTVELGRQAEVMIAEVVYVPSTSVFRVLWGGEIHEVPRQYWSWPESIYAGRRFQVSVDSQTDQRFLGDNETGILYPLVAFATNRFRIASAELPRLPGLARHVSYVYPSPASRDVSQLVFGSVETLTFQRTGSRVDTITSSMDPARSVRFVYSGTGTAERLGRVRTGADLATDTGALDGYVLHYRGCARLLASVRSLRDMPIVTWRLGVHAGRTVYDGVKHPGDPQWSYAITYPSSGPVIRVARSRVPNDPIDVTLDAEGRAVRAAEACKLDTSQGGRADNVYAAEYMGPSDLCPGRLRAEQLPTRDKFATTHYEYLPSGGESASCLLAETRRSSGDPSCPDGWACTHTDATTYAMTPVRLPNQLVTNKPDSITEALGRTTWFVYNAEHGLVDSAQVDGETTSYFYRDAGRTVVTRHPNGRYDARVSDADGFVRFERVNTDATGASTAETRTTEYRYEAGTRRLHEIVDPDGNVSVLEYTSAADDRVSSVVVTSPTGEELARTFTYAASFPRLPVAISLIVTRGEEVFGPITRRWNLLAGVDAPILESITQTLGTRTVTLARYSYDPVDPLRMTQRCGFSADGVPRGCETIAYWGGTDRKAGRPSVITDAAGYRTQIAYTACEASGDSRDVTIGGAQTIVRADTVDWFGRRATSSVSETGVGETTVFAYDLASRLGRATATSEGKTVRDLGFGYDGGGDRMVRASDAVSGREWQADYRVNSGTDARQLWRVSVMSPWIPLYRYEVGTAANGYDLAYNLLGQPLRMEVTVDGRGLAIEERAYTPAGRVRRITGFSGVSRDTAQPFVVEEREYDALGRLTHRWNDRVDQTIAHHGTQWGDRYVERTTTRTLGEPTYVVTESRQRDDLGRPLHVDRTSPALALDLEYDLEGRLDDVTRAIAGASTTEVLAFDYDALGRQTAVHRNGARLWTRGYDGAGRLASQADARPAAPTTVLQTSELGRRVVTTFADGTSQTRDFTYATGTSRFAKIVDTLPGGVTETIELDERLRPAVKTSTYQGASTVSYGYDWDTRLSSIQASFGGQVSTLAYTSFDDYGRPRAVSTTVQGAALPVIESAFDLAGRLVHQQYPDGAIPGGMAVDYVRNARGEIDEIRADDQPITTYVRAPNSSVVSQVVQGDATRTYHFDPGVPRLAGFVDEGIDKLTDVTYDYDDHHRLHEMVSGGLRQTTETYGYDAEQPLLTSFTSDNTVLPATRQYQTRLDGILAAYQGTVDGAFRSTVFDYASDAKGNPAREVAGAQRRFTWRASGIAQIRSASNQLLASFAQDPRGRIVRVTEGGVTTDMVRERGRVLSQKRGAQYAATVFDPDSGAPVLTRMSGPVTTTFRHFTDPRNGTTIGLRSATRSYAVFYDDVYPGATPRVKDDLGTQYDGAALAGFPNAWIHAIPRIGTGHAVTDRRLVDPGTRRFLSRDPMGFADGPNMYQYATGARGFSAVSPLDHVDPEGTLYFLFSWDDPNSWRYLYHRVFPPKPVPKTVPLEIVTDNWTDWVITKFWFGPPVLTPSLDIRETAGMSDTEMVTTAVVESIFLALDIVSLGAGKGVTTAARGAKEVVEHADDIIDVATKVDDIPVIGSMRDAAYRDAIATNPRNLGQPGIWTPELNDMWTRLVVDAGEDVHVASDILDPQYFFKAEGTTVFAQEFLDLVDAGYTYVRFGDGSGILLAPLR